MQAALLSLFFLTTCGFAQDDDISDNVEDLQRELIAERAKNRDLNQTISDILERMEDMEKNIMRNEEKITAVQADVGSNQDAITEIQGDVAAVQDDVIVVAADVEKNAADISTLATMGHWCGVQDYWTKVGTITYNRITFSDSNMNIAATPLDINTGIKKSHVLLLS